MARRATQRQYSRYRASRGRSAKKAASTRKAQSGARGIRGASKERNRTLRGLIDGNPLR